MQGATFALPSAYENLKFFYPGLLQVIRRTWLQITTLNITVWMADASAIGFLHRGGQGTPWQRILLQATRLSGPQYLDGSGRHMCIKSKPFPEVKAYSKEWYPDCALLILYVVCTPVWLLSSAGHRKNLMVSCLSGYFRIDYILFS